MLEELLALVEQLASELRDLPLQLGDVRGTGTGVSVHSALLDRIRAPLEEAYGMTRGGILPRRRIPTTVGNASSLTAVDY